MTKKRDGIPWEDILEEFPEEQKTEMKASAARACAEHEAILKFREMKEVMRSQLKSTEQLSTTDVREIEKNADIVLSSFREAVNSNGGQVKIVLEMPDQVQYNLYKLRDLYHEIEGTPLGPFYEEEDINEANQRTEERKIDYSEHFFKTED